MSGDDRSWMRLHKSTVEWQEKFQKFIETTFAGTSKGGEAVCPCARCRCLSYRWQSEVQNHLLAKGFDDSLIKEREGVRQSSPDENDKNTDDVGVDTPADASAINDLVSSLIRGTLHGDISVGEEEPNPSAKKFYKLLEEAQKELYPGCKEATKVSFIVRIFQIKCMYDLSNTALEAIILLFSRLLPEGHCVPNTMEKVQRVVRDLGLDYVKIDACENDCVLFSKDNAKLDTCPTCGESRWKMPDDGAHKGDEASETGSTKKRVPRKILRYFPLTPRLQRLYMSATTSSLMRWHHEGLVRDGKMRHPANSLAWKHVDGNYKWFASDPRNVRLGLASDGFNPFGMLNVNYTTWPVIIIPYNLPPWLCLKQPYWMMSMLIPGPKSPGNNIDVYLRPLIDELKDLWEKGIETWDAKVKKNFTLHAMLLWTINDFPAYAMLSGWSTKGKFACPYCHKDTDYLWLKFGSKHCYMGHRRFLPSDHKWRRNKASFNNQVEKREAPIPLTGEQVKQQYESFEQVTFGKKAKKRKQREEENRWHNWRKKSIFFNLPYWETLLIRHNLDIMHIEKNICESILGTLLEIDGKSKDSEKARLDMENMGIRKDQHPVLDKNKYTLPPALYSLGENEKTLLCKFLEGVKMPDGFASNIKRCVDVKACKVSGLKTHDFHVILQKLLPLVARHILPEEVAKPLIELSRFFNSICLKELVENDIEKLNTSIRETLCRLEMVFPPAFFDVMMHLPVHLAEEARLGGPVCYRWMYPIERYLRTVKGYVRNKAHPEGSIAEGYISEECMTFCSRFLEDIETKLDRADRHESATVNEPPSGLSIFGTLDYQKKGYRFEAFTTLEMKRMRHYIITNCDEARPWVDEHMEELKKISARNLDKRHKSQLVGWFEQKITKLYEAGKASDLLYALSQGPDPRPRVFNRCFIHNFLFRAASIEKNKNLSTQNSGVVVKGDDSTANMAWYGVIKKIISLEFPKEKEVVLFECDWYDVPAATKTKGRGYSKDQYGIIDIDTSRFQYCTDPYILASQAEQVFFVPMVKKEGWCSVVAMKPRNLFLMPENEDELDVDLLDVGVEDMNVSSQQEDLSVWTRSGIKGISGDASVIKQVLLSPVPEPDHDVLLDEDDDDYDDDTYINDGHVAPVTSLQQDEDDDFFV